MLVIDNFFAKPDEIRNYALSDQFEFSPRGENFKYEGVRSQCISEVDYDLFKSLCGEMIHRYCNTTSPFTFGANVFFHINKYEDMKDPVYNNLEKRIHKDENVLFSGLVYLAPNPPKGAGTIIYDDNHNIDITVENKYNRCLIFDSGTTPHAIGQLFGHDKYDSRLTLLCFITEFNCV
jgi:hypothetical protein